MVWIDGALILTVGLSGIAVDHRLQSVDHLLEGYVVALRRFILPSPSLSGQLSDELLLELVVLPNLGTLCPDMQPGNGSLRSPGFGALQENRRVGKPFRVADVPFVGQIVQLVVEAGEQCLLALVQGESAEVD